jgi:hypothetical protein
MLFRKFTQYSTSLYKIYHQNQLLIYSFKRRDVKELLTKFLIRPYLMVICKSFLHIGIRSKTLPKTIFCGSCQEVIAKIKH